MTCATLVEDAVLIDPAFESAEARRNMLAEVAQLIWDGDRRVIMTMGPKVGGVAQAAMVLRYGEAGKLVRGRIGCRA